MKASVPTPDNSARPSPKGRIFGLKRSTLSLITALTVGTPLLVACDNADSIPVNTEVTSTPVATTTEQTTAPTTTSKAPVVESTTSKAPKPEVTSTSKAPKPAETSTSKAPKPKPTSTKATTTSAKPAPSTTSAKPAEPTEETTSATPTTTSKAPKPKPSTTKVTTTSKAPVPTTTSAQPAEPTEEVPEGHKKALKSAQSLIDGDDGYSKSSLFDRLTNNSSLAHLIGGGYTDEEAFYAVENVEADWDAEAVEHVNGELERFSPISRYMLYLMLAPNFLGGGFNQSQLDYAFAQLHQNTWQEQAIKEARIYTLNNDPTRADLINFLVNRERYTQKEAEYAADQVGLTK